MGRQLKTKCRVLPDNLPKEPRSNEDLRKADQKDSARQNLDRWRGAWPLTPLKPRDWVLVKADEESVWKKEGKVVAADSKKCTYLVNSSAGVLRLNRKHLQKLPLSRRVVTDSPNSSISSTSDSQDVNYSKNIDSKDFVDPKGAAPSSAPPTATHIAGSARGYIERKSNYACTDTTSSVFSGELCEQFPSSV